MSECLDLDKLRTRLAEARGPRYWRALEEIAETPEFQAYLDDEFPHRVLDTKNAASRRKFLSVMGASLALAGVSACTKQPRESIVPYVRQPPEYVPGEAMFYATTVTAGGYGTGVLVESHLGRPTKIEGNPDHPASLGATTPHMQASVLGLYDPDRSQTVLRDGNIDDWGNFITTVNGALDNARSKRGAGIRLLTRAVISPTLSAQIRQFLSQYPEARWHQWDPFGQHAERAGWVAAFGAPWNAVYHFERAMRIVSLDADFLSPLFPGSLRYTRDYSGLRRAAAESASSDMPRLYVAETAPSITGGMADHRFRMRGSEVEAFAAGLLNPPSDVHRAIARDLESHRGSSLVIAGSYQTPRVHAIAHALNQRLGNAGKTVVYTDSVEANSVDHLASIRELVSDMRSGAVETLIMIGGNPVYDAPADLDFLDALKRVKLRAHLSPHNDETSAWCHWHIPEAHYLESWSDARAWDGTASIVQPLIAPIYDGKTSHEILNVLVDQPDRTPHDTVQDYWRGMHKSADFDDWWAKSLHDGVIAGSAFPEQMPPAARVPDADVGAGTGLEVLFRPDPNVIDGSMANNAWLQELPKPESKLTWDNAVLISPRSAERRGLSTGDVVEIASGDRKVTGPVWILPGHADEAVTIHAGYGRSRAGRVGDGIGFNAYGFRTSRTPWRTDAANLTRRSSGYSFATTQITQTMEERDPFHVTTVAEYRRNPQPGEAPLPTLFPLWPYPDHKWGMSIDLTACTGCNACMVACQAENNIAVVGKEQVAMGRHMNWIRVDRYYAGPLDDPQTYFQPVPCMHCENALCELVCPVAATVHSREGLNEMVYNRCVGTRYCSNNCPYKVRRFNFVLYSDWDTQSLYGVRNPDVTVRSRGVMEKCSYCVQRISRAKIDAEKQDRPVRDGDIVTACQQACPAEAIVFGDLNDPNSKVSRRKRQQRDYGLLADLNTRPRTTYLARLHNPNPDLEKA